MRCLYRRCLVSVVCAIAVGGLIAAPMETSPAHVIHTRDIQLIDSADSLLGDGAALVIGGSGLRMAVRESGRPAVTHYRVLERFRAHSYLSVQLETGRTHQIRLHLSHLKYPIVGDPVYGGRFAQPKGASVSLVDTLRAFKRQALHAASLGFDHPRTGKRLQLDCPVPTDFAALLLALRDDARLAAQDLGRKR